MPTAAHPTEAERASRLTHVYALHGAEYFVERVGRGWVVWVEGSRTPGVFSRKWEALDHAENRVLATIERLREGA